MEFLLGFLEHYCIILFLKFNPFKLALKKKMLNFFLEINLKPVWRSLITVKPELFYKLLFF